MNYMVLSGKYETGTQEQQAGYATLFGEEDIQEKFDLYFHWYNLLHETGHCLVSESGCKMTRLKEELFVNEFAVGYYKLLKETERLEKLRKMLDSSLSAMSLPVTEGQSAWEYYEEMLGTDEKYFRFAEKLMSNNPGDSVMLYGGLQLCCVLEAMKRSRSFSQVLSDLGIDAYENADFQRCDLSTSSENTQAHFDTALSNLKAFGITLPVITLSMPDDPMVQCACPENQ